MPTDVTRLAAIAATAIQDAVAAGDWGEAERLIRRAHRIRDNERLWNLLWKWSAIGTNCGKGFVVSPQ